MRSAPVTLPVTRIRLSHFPQRTRHPWFEPSPCAGTVPAIGLVSEDVGWAVCHAPVQRGAPLSAPRLFRGSAAPIRWERSSLQDYVRRRSLTGSLLSKRPARRGLTSERNDRTAVSYPIGLARHLWTS